MRDNMVWGIDMNCYIITLFFIVKRKKRVQKNTVIGPFKAASHRHQDCLDAAIVMARRLCDASGQRFTRLRQRVLELVWQSHAPVKAYDILEELRDEHGAAAPPTVYRVLDFLRAQGLVHKIESLNAYVGCGNPGAAHSGQFLICRDCARVAEMDDPQLRALLRKKAARLGFEVDGQIIEINGRCHECLQQKGENQ